MSSRNDSLRKFLGYMYARYMSFRWRGKVCGPDFLMRKKDLMRVTHDGRISIGSGTFFEKGLRFITRAKVTIGSNVYVGKNATIVAFSELEIGSNTLIGENVSIHTENHGNSGFRLEYESVPIHIGEDVWIGAGVVITSGVKIGNGATIGANAVVTKSIPAGSTAVGIPARVIKQSTK